MKRILHSKWEPPEEIAIRQDERRKKMIQDKLEQRKKADPTYTPRRPPGYTRGQLLAGTDPLLRRAHTGDGQERWQRYRSIAFRETSTPLLERAAVREVSLLAPSDIPTRRKQKTAVTRTKVYGAVPLEEHVNRDTRKKKKPGPESFFEDASTSNE